MPSSINTNIASLAGQKSLARSEAQLQNTLQRLSSGLRINSAKDDAAGLAISTGMMSQTKGLTVATRNASDAISLLQTTDGALSEVTNILQRMRELSIQSANGIYSDADRGKLHTEVSQLKQELTRLGDTTTFNGKKVLDGSMQNIGFQVGTQAGQTISVSINDTRSSGLGSNVVTTNNTTNGLGRATFNSRVSTDGFELGVPATVSKNSFAALSNGYDAQTLTVRDASGAVVANGAVGMNANDQLSTVIGKLNDIKGVTATGYNQIKLADWTAASSSTDTITFKISSGGASETIALSSAKTNSSQATVFGQLASQINSNTNLQNAGVVAGLDSAGNLVVRNNTGADMGAQLFTSLDTAGPTVKAYGSDINNGYATLTGTTDSVLNAATDFGLNIGAAQTAAAAIPATNGVAAQALTIKDDSGTIVDVLKNTEVTVNQEASATAALLNGLGITGLSATATTTATISAWSTLAAGATAVSLDITGIGAMTLTGITGASTNDQFMTALASDVNNNSTLAGLGITASLDTSGGAGAYKVALTDSGGQDITLDLTVTGVGVESNRITVTGSDSGASTVNLTSTLAAGVEAAGATDTTRVGGRMAITLPLGYTIESNVASGLAAGQGGLFSGAADLAANTRYDNATRSGGQMNVFLSNGYTIESSVASSTTAGGGLFKASANAAATVAESNVGIADVMSGQDTRNLIISGGDTVGRAQTVQSAATANTNGYDVQTLKIRDASGTVINGGTLTTVANESAKSIAGKLAILSGITASASNEATITSFTRGAAVDGGKAITISVTSGSSTYSTALSGVTTNSSQTDIFKALRDQLNTDTTMQSAGVSAALNNSGQVVIKNTTGEDLALSLSIAVDADTVAETLGTMTVVGHDAARTAITLTASDTGGDALAGTANETVIGGRMEIALPDGYTIESNLGKTTGLFNASTNTAVDKVVTAANYGNNVAAQTLTIAGTATSTVSVSRDESAKAIAEKVNGATGTTGVTAEALTRVKLSGLSDAGVVGFSLYGDNSSAVSISASVTGSNSTANLTALANAINAKSDTTGITASLTDNNAAITLEHKTGANIVLANFTHSAGTAPSSTNIAGKAASLSVAGMAQSVDADGVMTSTATTATKLYAGGVANSGADSAVIGGTVAFRSSEYFNVSSSVDGSSIAVKGGDSSLFSGTAGTGNASFLSSMASVDISTVDGANNALAVIDEALASITTARASLGAAQNRFDSTNASLASSILNTSAANSRILDTDFASETANLSKSQILQQAGIAMLSQANQAPQAVLSLLK